MILQIFDTSALKPYKHAYEQAKKQLEQLYEMNVFANKAVLDEDLQKGYFEEGSIFFNYDEQGERKSIRIIPYFNQKSGMHAIKHPIVINTKDMSTTVVFNASAYGNLGSDGIVKIRQSSIAQFHFMIGMSLFLGAAYAGIINSRTVLSYGHIVANSYAVCMSQGLGRSFSLDYNKQLNVQAICAYFYYRSLLNVEHNEAIKLSALSTKLDEVFISSLVDNEDCQQVQTIADLCECLVKYSASERLSDLTVTTMYTVLKQYWLGDNGAELVCASYEMPHVWALLCYSSVEHVLYKRNNLSEIIKNSSKHFDVQQLTHSIRAALTLKDHQ